MSLNFTDIAVIIYLIKRMRMLIALRSTSM